MTTVVLGVVGIVAYIWMSVRTRARQRRYNFVISPLPVFAVQILVVAGIVGFVTYRLAQQYGISWTLVILALVTAVMVILQTRTRFGRHVYGVGGNPEAAELSGVSVAKVTVLVFVIMQTLVALSGILYASRMKAAAPTAGTGFELLVIAGAFIGGCSPAGGVGKVQGSIVGALIMQSLVNGMMLMQVDASLQYIIQGAILVIAVLFDILSRRSGAVAAVSASPIESPPTPVATPAS
jgi:putative multiple sugar transport system permease protein